MINAVIFDMYETLITLLAGPLYFGEDIADDLEIAQDDFLPLWRSTEHDRTVGRSTLVTVLTDIMERLGCFSQEKLDLIIKKRTEAKREAFEYMNDGIIPMMKELKRRNILIGLISNCYCEEAEAIRASVLFPLFDAVCLSSEEGVRKPDREIFERCLNRLGLSAEECLYVGDGGSRELEAAHDIGMKTAQALWYLEDGPTQTMSKKYRCAQLKKPIDILDLIQGE